MTYEDMIFYIFVIALNVIVVFLSVTVSGMLIRRDFKKFNEAQRAQDRRFHE